MTVPHQRLVIIAADFNKDVVEPMIEAAQNELNKQGAEIVRVVRVPGAYEVPLIASAYLARANVDALVVLGFIERGETLHGEVMGHVVHGALVQLQLQHQKPVGMGIVGPGATVEQAHARKISAACAAVRSALRSCELLGDSRN